MAVQVQVRRGTRLDVGDAADLLNAIISAGGTTALTGPLSEQALWDWLSADADQSAWQVAEDGGRVVGFQWIGPFPGLPPGACEIGTFVRSDVTGLGIGTALFEATRKAAMVLGYAWINAEIRADNEGGLIYYQSRGFRDYGLREGVCLESGLIVDKVLKRFDLK